MWLASYTVGPQLYHVTLRPRIGTKGTFERVSELYTCSTGSASAGAGEGAVHGGCVTRGAAAPAATA